MVVLFLNWYFIDNHSGIGTVQSNKETYWH